MISPNPHLVLGVPGPSSWPESQGAHRPEAAPPWGQLGLALAWGKGHSRWRGLGPFLAEGFLTSEMGVRLNLVPVPAAGKLLTDPAIWEGTADVIPGGTVGGFLALRGILFSHETAQ